MRVREAMTTRLITVLETDTAISALRTVVRHGVSGVPVVRGNNQLVGLVTEFDLLLALEFIGEAVPVSKIMNPHVTAVGPDTPLSEVRELLVRHCFRRVPVLSKGKLVGIVSRRDLLRMQLTDSAAKRVVKPAAKRRAKLATKSVARALAKSLSKSAPKRVTRPAKKATRGKRASK